MRLQESWSRARLGALSLCLCCIAPAVVADDDANAPTTVRVDCSRETIGDALTRHRSRPLVVTVEGTCEEDVLIDRGQVRLIAADPGVDGITGQANDGAAITVSGARDVVIDGLRLRSAGGGSTSGVVVTRSGNATIQRAVIEGSAHGIRAAWGGFFVLRDSHVVGNRLNGLLLTDSAAAWVESCTIDVSNSSGDAAAIGALRSIYLRLRGDNLVRNRGDDGIAGNDDDGTAIEALHMAEIRQDGGLTSYTGRLEFGDLVHASLRNPEIVGSIDISDGSQVEIRDFRDGPEVTGGGDIHVFSNSRLDFSRSNAVVQAGSISVGEGSSVNFAPGAAVTVANDLDVFESSVDLGQGSRLEVAGSMRASEHSGLGIGPGTAVNVANDIDVFQSSIALGPGSSTDVAGGVRASENSRFGIDSNAVVNVASDVEVFRSSVYIGPGSSLNIDGIVDCGGSEVTFANPPIPPPDTFEDCTVNIGSL